MGGFWHGLAIFFGLTNGSGHAYLFWSGTGSDLGEVTILGAIVAGARHANCHTKGCWRLGHPLEGTPFRVCHKHVPTNARRARNVSHDVIVQAHHAATKERE